MLIFDHYMCVKKINAGVLNDCYVSEIRKTNIELLLSVLLNPRQYLGHHTDPAGKKPQIERSPIPN